MLKNQIHLRELSIKIIAIMEDRKEIKDLLKWDDEQRKIIMKKLNFEASDLENLRLWGKWLKYFFWDEIFEDYNVLKVSLDEWLKDVEEVRTEDDSPFGIEQAFLLKTYYDEVCENLFLEFLVKSAKDEKVKKILQTTPGFIPGETETRTYNQRVEHIESSKNIAQAIAKDAIGHIKWLISKSDEETKKTAFNQYRVIQSSLLRLEILKLSVILVKVENDHPVDFILTPSTKKDVQDIGEYFLEKSKAELTEENKADKMRESLDFYSHLFQKTMTRGDIELALSFLFDGNEDGEALRAAYRFLYEYALSEIFVYWMFLRSTLKIVDYALK